MEDILELWKICGNKYPCIPEQEFFWDLYFKSWLSVGHKLQNFFWILQNAFQNILICSFNLILFFSNVNYIVYQSSWLIKIINIKNLKVPVPPGSPSHSSLSGFWIFSSRTDIKGYLVLICMFLLLASYSFPYIFIGYTELLFCELKVYIYFFTGIFAFFLLIETFYIS